MDTGLPRSFTSVSKGGISHNLVWLLLFEAEAYCAFAVPREGG